MRLRLRNGRLDPRSLTLVCAVALACFFAGTAQSGRHGRPPSAGAYVQPGLLAAAQADPGGDLKVILQGSAGHGPEALAADVHAAAAGVPGNGAGVGRLLETIQGASAEVTGAQLLALARVPGIAAITADEPVHLTGGIGSVGSRAGGTDPGGTASGGPPSGGTPATGGLSTTQQWPFASDVAQGWSTVTNGSLPTPPAIAVVDSGIQSARPDFSGGRRVIAQVTLTGSSGNSPGDGYGHGTFVAGIAAGSAAGYAGAAPSAPIVSIDVIDDQGMGLTSDVIAACDWIVQHKDAYDIRVANFSLHSAAPASVFWDPLDRAVEKLWFDGITVVTSAGNYAVGGQPSGVFFAPGNDPFVITVGAADIHGTVSTTDDTAAPWSSFGYTFDGFAKPELAAPGRYMVGPVPSGSTLATTRPGSVVAPGYMELSGTSFAAPVVAGAAAYLLARHPSWTPDQVKGALMLTATSTPSAAPMSEGVGELNAAAAALVTAPPNPNLALDAFVGPDPDGGSIPVFDTAGWQSAALASASWSDASWSDASWATASWSDASWSDASWSDASWATASWSDASWSDASWSDASWSDLALVDYAASDGVVPTTGP